MRSECRAAVGTTTSAHGSAGNSSDAISHQVLDARCKADLIAVALETSGVENPLNKGKGCPDCGAPLRFEEGCQKCESCGCGDDAGKIMLCDGCDN